MGNVVVTTVTKSSDGAVADAILESFPRCNYWAMDRSDHMRAHARNRLEHYGDRIQVLAFQLESSGWRTRLPDPLDRVVASLVVHHLDDAGKRGLFADLAEALRLGGGLIIADIVLPASRQSRELFARQGNCAAEQQSLRREGRPAAYETFESEQWNYYSDPTPDSYDTPSRLMDQMSWLKDAGFREVDCVWMAAGHAILAAFK